MALKLREIELITSNDESDVYGDCRWFVAEEGDIEDIPNYRAAFVETRIGGNLQNADRRGIVTTITAAQVYPPMLFDKTGNAASYIETKDRPSAERIEALSLEIAQFACGDLISPFE